MSTIAKVASAKQRKLYLQRRCFTSDGRVQFAELLRHGDPNCQSVLTLHSGLEQQLSHRICLSPTCSQIECIKPR